ncbi:MAG: TIGR02530 family flagellar biosynthesis protein [Bdellovibrionales bacterium]
MDLKKLQSFETLVPSQSPLKPNVGGGVQGPSFKDTLKETLNRGTEVAELKPGMSESLEKVKFSNHALDRMRTRGITFTPDDVSRLNEAVNRAAAKGSKDSLVLMNDSALIVSVKNKTVVTVMDKTALKENVFTNIDSTVVL